MSELSIIFAREFIARVRTRAFIISTLFVPLFFAGVMLLPQLVGGGAQRNLALVNETTADIGRDFIDALQALPASSSDNTYHVELAQGDAALRANLNQRVLRNEIDGFVVIPAGIVDGVALEYHARTISSPLVNRELERAANRAVQGERLRRAGISSGELQSLIQAVPVKGMRVTKDGEQEGSTLTAFLLAYVVAFASYMVILLYGINMMRSVLEEKTNRIAEVILSTVRPGYFLAGKVLGLAATALLQVCIWVSAAIVIAGPSGLAARFGASSAALKMFAIEPWIAASLVAFFVLGFLLYASLFAAMGATVSSEQEAQSMQHMGLIPLLIPMLFITLLTNDLHGKAATILGMIPFTSPVAMSMRLAAAPISAGEVWVSLGLLTVALIAMLWLAGRIFRIGILSTGAKPNLKELWRWLRA